MLTQAQLNQVKRLLKDGIGMRKIGARTGVSYYLVSRIARGENVLMEGQKRRVGESRRQRATPVDYAKIRRDAIALNEHRLARLRGEVA